MEAAAAASEAQSVYTGERKNGRMGLWHLQVSQQHRLHGRLCVLHTALEPVCTVGVHTQHIHILNPPEPSLTRHDTPLPLSQSWMANSTGRALKFAGAGKFHAKWVHGKAVMGSTSSDGLAYTEPEDGDWAYCTRTAALLELVEGPPGGDSQLANAHPPKAIPLGTYDVGGYLDERDGKVYPY